MVIPTDAPKILLIFYCILSTRLVFRRIHMDNYPKCCWAAQALIGAELIPISLLINSPLFSIINP